MRVGVRRWMEGVRGHNMLILAYRDKISEDIHYFQGTPDISRPIINATSIFSYYSIIFMFIAIRQLSIPSALFKESSSRCKCSMPPCKPLTKP
jgi:hypothetical protein